MGVARSAHSASRSGSSRRSASGTDAAAARTRPSGDDAGGNAQPIGGDGGDGGGGAVGAFVLPLQFRAMMVGMVSSLSMSVCSNRSGSAGSALWRTFTELCTSSGFATHSTVTMS